MTDKTRTMKGIEALADELVADILQASPDVLAAEAREDGIDIEARAKDLRAKFERTLVMSNKAMMERARAGATAARNDACSTATVTDIATARSRLAAVSAGSAGAGRMTLAARNETEMTDNDILGMDADLRELQALAGKTPTEHSE